MKERTETAGTGAVAQDRAEQQAASRRGFAKAAVAALAVVGFGGAALNGVLARQGDDDAREGGSGGRGSGGRGSGGRGSGGRGRRRRRGHRRRRRNGGSGSGSGSGSGNDD